MADTDAIREIGGQFISRITGGVLWGGIALFAFAVVGFLMWYFFIYKRKFDIKVKIISERSGDRYRIIFDRAAILNDRKTNTKFFRVWGMKIDLPSPKFNVMQITNEGDYLELYRTSEDDIYFLTPSQVDKRKFIRADGSRGYFATQENKMIDPDIAYWSVQRKKDNKKMFDPESMLMKILPWIPHIMGGILIIFILYVLFDSLPTILSEMRELARTLNAQQSAQIITGG